MESPVVLDKPPEYHGHDDRGFPFDDEEGSGSWSELAARHPDIAARLRQRPATWARKRRPSSQDATEDFGDSFSGFDRFPFDDIPPEFREHFPSHWNRRFGSRDEPPPPPQAQAQASPPTPQPQQQTAATQTEQIPETTDQQYNNLPQYGLRNTVDLGQKSPADPSLVDADARNLRSMSAPPDTRNLNQNTMNSQNHHQDQAQSAPQAEQHSNVRHIPIFVEGRDEPVINKNVDSGTHFGETKPTFQPPPPPPQAHPHIDRDQYFADDVPSFHHPPNFSRAYGTPFNKGFRQGPQPFVQQKVYPQGPFARGASPQRSQSPKPPPHHPEEHFVKVPVHHEPPKTDPSPSKPQQKQAPPPQQPPPQREQTPPQAPPKPQPPSANDPITQILSIQTDVLNLMTEVENFTGTKKDKRYIFLDEMLTRNLIKLDNIETEGKENIRQARKEAIRCIQKCIAVLEAKADNNSANTQKVQDVEMNENKEEAAVTETAQENGEVEMTQGKTEGSVEAQVEKPPPPQDEKKDEVPKDAEATPNNVETTQPQTADTRPGDKPPEANTEKQPEEQKDTKVDNKTSPKKKVVKKNRDKSASKESDKVEAAKDSNKKDDINEKVEVMQVDDKAQSMEIDGGTSQ